MKGLIEKEHYRVGEVAAYFDVSHTVVYKWIDHGLLKAAKYGGCIRIERIEVQNFKLASRMHPLK